MTAPTAAAPVLEPVTQKFIDTLSAAGGPPLYTLSPADARNVLTGVQAQSVAKLPASIAGSKDCRCWPAWEPKTRRHCGVAYRRLCSC